MQYAHLAKCKMDERKQGVLGTEVTSQDQEDLVSKESQCLGLYRIW